MKWGGPAGTETAPCVTETKPAQGNENMTDSTVGPRSPEDEPPAGGAVLLALLADWGIALRLVLLIGVPITAVVVLVALVVIYLGAVGVGALVTLGGGGWGAARLLAQRRVRRATRS